MVVKPNNKLFRQAFWAMEGTLNEVEGWITINFILLGYLFFTGLYGFVLSSPFYFSSFSFFSVLVNTNPINFKLTLFTLNVFVILFTDNTLSND